MVGVVGRSRFTPLPFLLSTHTTSIHPCVCCACIFAHSEKFRQRVRVQGRGPLSRTPRPVRPTWHGLGEGGSAVDVRGRAGDGGAAAADACGGPHAPARPVESEACGPRGAGASLLEARGGDYAHRARGPTAHRGSGMRRPRLEVASRTHTDTGQAGHHVEARRAHGHSRMRRAKVGWGVGVGGGFSGQGLQRSSPRRSGPCHREEKKKRKKKRKKGKKMNGGGGGGGGCGCGG